MSYSSNSPAQKRNLKPTTSISAAPSLLTIPSDIASTYQPTYQNPNPYASYAQPAQISPTNPRKRRASELGPDVLLGASMQGPSSGPMDMGSLSNAGGFGDPQVMAGSSRDVGMELPSASPVAKKGRTNTPWTPAEEQRLKTMRDAGDSWSEIAKTFPARTEGSVKKHWYKVCLIPALGPRPRRACASDLGPRSKRPYGKLADGEMQDMHYAEFAEDEVSNFVRLSLSQTASGLGD
ncbi:hypothetical protein LTR66_008975 [Elasticomyces elasticus]|nr:hypothetical protein LTR66_008975 [Elasticomyces elasticus]